MAAYGDDRDEEYLKRLKRPIDDFASRYNANPDGDHKTIFLFPGGLGSHLIRANKTAENGPPFAYNTVWLDCSIAVGAARHLAMQGDVDLDKHYVLPDGCIDFIFLRPYAGFIQWCQTNWLDLFVFGWDWRRTTENNAKFFLTKFLPMFEVALRHLDPPPLNNFWLIGHSFGGMVVKKILNLSNDSYVQKMQGAITVATPFYGYGGHLHRFFKGVSLLNWSEEPNGAARITEIASSLPAGYELLFLDETTYKANQSAFSNDKDGYNLKDYPIKDAKDIKIWADPYNPIPGTNGTVRYIATHGFKGHLLKDGRNALHELSKALQHPIDKKFYNIRGVQKKGGKVLKKSVVGQKWKLVPPGFDPDKDDDPITDQFGPGDGVLPAWSTRLLNSDPNVITVRGDFEHMTMMNEKEVQKQIAKLLKPGKKQLARLLKTAKTTKLKAASRARLDILVQKLGVNVQGLSPEARNNAIRKLLAGYDPDELQKLLGRAYLDALKSPTQTSSRRGNRKRTRRR